VEAPAALCWLIDLLLCRPGREAEAALGWGGRGRRGRRRDRVVVTGGAAARCWDDGTVATVGIRVLDSCGWE
jgi:hypothetical protein